MNKPTSESEKIISSLVQTQYTDEVEKIIFFRGIITALTNTELLHAQGLYTQSEIDQAMKEGAELPTDEEVAIEILARFTRMGRGKDIAKAGFIDCYNWIKTRKPSLPSVIPVSGWIMEGLPNDRPGYSNSDDVNVQQKIRQDAFVKSMQYLLEHPEVLTVLTKPTDEPGK